MALSRHLLPGDGTHLTSETTTWASVYYNVGIVNGELTGGAWNSPNSQKQKLLKDDIKKIINNQENIELILLCEFGNMAPTIDELLSSMSPAEKERRGVLQPAEQSRASRDTRQPRLS